MREVAVAELEGMGNLYCTHRKASGSVDKGATGGSQGLAAAEAVLAALQLPAALVVLEVTGVTAAAAVVAGAVQVQ